MLALYAAMPRDGSSPGGGDVHDGTCTLLLHVRRDRLAQPQRGSQIDVDHEPQRFGSRGERVSWPERTDGVYQHTRRPNFGRDPVDERPHHLGVGRVGHLAPDTVGSSRSPRSFRSTATTVRPLTARVFVIA